MVCCAVCSWILLPFKHLQSGRCGGWARVHKIGCRRHALHPFFIMHAVIHLYITSFLNAAAVQKRTWWPPGSHPNPTLLHTPPLQLTAGEPLLLSYGPLSNDFLLMVSYDCLATEALGF